jgi:hypothetical protein
MDVMTVPGSDDTWPEGRSREPVPGLPPEWGEIVIPDDPTELDAESRAVRRELGLPADLGLRGAAPRTGMATLAALRPVLLTMAAAVLMMLISLLVAVWPGGQRQPAVQRPSVTGGSTGRTQQAVAPGRMLPALELVDEKGRAVPLRGLLPAVIVLIDGCTCADQVRTLADIAPDAVTVAAVTPGRALPQLVGTPSVRALADPASELRGLVPAAAPNGAATALLVDRSGWIVETLTTIDDPDLYRTDVVALAGR